MKLLAITASIMITFAIIMLFISELGVGNYIDHEKNNLSGEGNGALIYLDGDEIVAQDFNGTTIARGKKDADTYLMIKAANDHLRMLGSGKLKLIKGTYEGNGSNFYPSSNIKIEGDGESTILNNIGICIQSGSYISIRNIKFTGDSNFAVMIREGSKEILMEDLFANLSAVSKGAFIQYADNGVISNTSFIGCRAVNNGGFGFLNDGKGNSSLIKNSTYLDCEAIRCGHHTRYDDWITGFDIAEGCNVENVRLKNCTAEQNWESGFHLENKPSKINVEIIDCKSIKNGRSKIDPTYGAGFLVSSGVSLVGCEAYNNEVGYRVSVNNDKLVSMVGCKAFDNGIGYRVSINNNTSVTQVGDEEYNLQESQDSINKGTGVSIIDCTSSGSTASIFFINEIDKMYIENISIK